MQQLTGFVLGLLFAVYALGEFTSLAHQGQEGLSMTGNVLASDPKEAVDHRSSMAGTRMIGLGGRKMVAQKVLKKLEPARPAGLNGEAGSTSSKNSGEDSKASSNTHGKPENKLTQQGNIKILEPATPKSPSAASTSEIPRDVKLKSKQPTKADQQTTNYDGDDDDDDDNADDHNLTDDDDAADDHNLTDETRRLLKATREIVSLMHKDYHRMGNRNPPINNNEPQH